MIYDPQHVPQDKNKSSEFIHKIKRFWINGKCFVPKDMFRGWRYHAGDFFLNLCYHYLPELLSTANRSKSLLKIKF